MHATCIPHVEGGLSAREHAHVARFVTSHGSSLCKVRAPLPHDADGCMRAFAGMRFSPTRSKKRACVLVRSVASRVESSPVESSRVQSSRVESSRVESRSSQVESSRVESSRVKKRACVLALSVAR